MQRQANDVAFIPEALHPVHQLPHQKQPATFLFSEVLIGGAVDRALVEVESRPFIDDF